MITEIFWIDGIQRGRLGISARPRGGDWLEDEIHAWREAGVDLVVSLLTPAEVSELALEGEEAACRRQGMDFRSLAIPDRGVPPSIDPLNRLAAALWAALDAGKSVAVHCRQGIGRSSMVAAMVMMSSGEDPDHALRRIEKARGCAVPETTEQRNWILHFAGAVNQNAQQTDRSYRRVAGPKSHS